jgi:hypothetical protein
MKKEYLEKILNIFKDKRIIFFVVFVLLWITRNTAVNLPIIIGFIIWMYVENFKTIRVKLWDCLKFLGFEAILISLMGTIFILNFLSVRNNIILEAIASVGCFILIYSLFYVLVAIKAEKKVARLTIIIIATLITITYTIASLGINLIPLSISNNIITNYSGSNEIVDLVLMEYDGRIILNSIIQIITYPIWICSLIGTIILEIRE